MRDVTMDMLPESHRRIAEVIGVEAALKLCETYGGVVLYVTKADSVYASVRDQMICREYNGINTSALARKYRVTTRTVQKIVENTVPKLEGQISIEDIM